MLYAIPSTLRIGALGTLGSLGTIFGLGALVWWFWFRAQLGHPIDEAPRNPIRLGLLLFTGAMLLSYIAAMTRALPVAEISPADTGLLRVGAMVGIAVIALDGPPTEDRFLAIIRRFALAGGLIALLGIAQFMTNLPLVDQITLPGLSANSDYSSLDLRGGFARPAATSAHPLEYAVILSMTLPLAIVYALHSRGSRAVLLWTMSALILVGVLLSSSRSAYIGLAAALAPLLLALGPGARRLILTLILALGGLTYLIVPRVITNLRFLFESIGNDASAASRTSSYALVESMFANFPVTGRGFSTLLPAYRILDNQYLLFLVETGALGLLTLIGLLAASAFTPLGARRRSHTPLMNDIGVALTASLLAGASLLALFDALSFPQAAGTLFLVIGLSGAYRRLVTPAEPAASLLAGGSSTLRMYP
ncbi:O-antigen ligase family protein [Microterricola viridarii]|uniref:O-antigen ligase family protein n=1 Tax=Microterricola viridarii TaxID=412690 RepID=UPI001560CCF4|nr:O-antigen ligase family protein [Microterricola viridarii]